MDLANTYVQLDELKNHLNIPSTNHDFDLSLELSIDAVCREIDAWVGRQFFESTGSRYYTATAAGCLPVDDLLAVTALRTSTDGDGATHNTTLSSTCYRLAPWNAQSYSPARPYGEIEILSNSSGVLPVGTPRGVEVVGVWGFNYATALPPAVKMAALYQAAYNFRGRESAGTDEYANRISGGGLHPFVRQALQPFRVPVIG
jgi:hypothetical protein